MVGSDCDMNSAAEGFGVIEFTTKEVDELLNETFENKFDLKEKIELMTEQNKRFKLCIKWLQQVHENRVREKEKLQSEMESVKKKYKDYELRCLRGEPQQVRDGCDRQVTKVQPLIAQLVKWQEFSRKVLERLAIELKAKMHLSPLEARTELEMELEAQKRLVRDLQDRLSDKEFQLKEGEKLAKQLKNTIMELMDDDDGVGTETIDQNVCVAGLKAEGEGSFASFDG